MTVPVSIRLTALLVVAGCSVATPPPKVAEPPAAKTAAAFSPAAPEPPANPAPAPALPQEPATATAPAPKAPPSPPAKPVAAARPAAKAPPAATPSATPTSTAQAQSTAPPTKPPLDLKSLEQRLKGTDAIGVLTKLSLKNQVSDLVSRFNAFHAGNRPPTLAELRPAYELLLMKVLSLLQDKDPALANEINASRGAIWGVLTDSNKLAQYNT